MRFESNTSDVVSRAYSALEFLRRANETNQLNEIENMDYVLDCLDISNDLEYAYQKLKENHIDY